MTAAPSSMTDPAHSAQPQAAPSLPRLLAGIPPHGMMSLQEHLAAHDAMPDPGGRRHGRGHSDALVDEIDRAGLLGRGGAAFPTARKMRAVAGARGRPIAVVNGAEGEPASLKDRTLMELAPHLVIDGAILAAEALGADEAILCVCESAEPGIQSMELALDERERSGGGDRSASRAPRLHLAVVPGHYVAGQESALVNHLNGGPAKPTFTPPMPFEQGVRRRPTLINNTETVAHIALIARHGAEWFRQLGTPSQPGSTLLTLSGPVAHPGVYEIELGASLTSLIDAGGGTTSRVRGALIGGYAGTWISAERLHGIALSGEHLAPHGASLGAGVVLLLSEEACPVAETARVARWLAGQSTGQCGPCVHGLDSLASTVEEIAAGVAEGKAMQRIDRLTWLVRGRGACGHPDGAVNFVVSALEAFAADFADHARHGACESCARPAEVPLPVRPVDAEAARGRGALR